MERSQVILYGLVWCGGVYYLCTVVLGRCASAVEYRRVIRVVNYECKLRVVQLLIEKTLVSFPILISE